MRIERRSFASALRFSDAPSDATSIATIAGYAAVFNSLSTEMGPGGKRFKERLLPGAFRAELLRGAQVWAYWFHGIAGGFPGVGFPLGDRLSGSLRLREDARGLGFELDLADTGDARDLVALLRRGTPIGASFAFGGAVDVWRQEVIGLVRTISAISDLVDVSPTHTPAYTSTVTGLRGHADTTADAQSRRRRLYLIDLEQDVDRRRRLTEIKADVVDDRRRHLDRLLRSTGAPPFDGDAA